MKINLLSKVLIGSMALTSCTSPTKNFIYRTPVVKNIDTFTFSGAEKTLDLSKNIRDFFADITSPNKVSHKKSKKVTAKKPVSNTRPEPVNSVERELVSTMNNHAYCIRGANISYAKPCTYEIKGSAQSGKKIASANGVSLYRLQLANPEISFEKSIPAGTVVNIPERYVVTPGSVKNFDDVVSTTQISKDYINDILICIEGRNKKPDLVCQSDRVRSREYPNGCPTIGFGHTGRVDGKVIVNGKTRITEEKAYELLAQDILDAKLDAIVYMGKDLFNRAPKSIQTGIIDIVFNKGVEPFTRAGSPTTFIKSDLEKADYAAAAAHTVLRTGNRGLKKRNVYRVISSTENLSQQERNRALDIAKRHYLETLNHFGKGSYRANMQKAWANAKNGVTNGFFNK